MSRSEMCIQVCTPNVVLCATSCTLTNLDTRLLGTVAQECTSGRRQASSSRHYRWRCSVCRYHRMLVWSRAVTAVTLTSHTRRLAIIGYQFLLWYRPRVSSLRSFPVAIGKITDGAGVRLTWLPQSSGASSTFLVVLRPNPR